MFDILAKILSYSLFTIFRKNCPCRQFVLVDLEISLEDLVKQILMYHQLKYFEDLALNLMKQKFTLKLLPMHPYPSSQVEIDYMKYQKLMLYSKVINLDQVF